MIKLSNIGASNYAKHEAWPAIAAFNDYHESIKELINLSGQELGEKLNQLQKTDVSKCCELIMNALCTIYSIYFRYSDSPFTDELDEYTFLELMRLKIYLEKEMINKIFSNIESAPLESYSSVQACYEYLAKYSSENLGKTHVFFDFVSEEMTYNQMREFLFNEVIRNEIVDDEIALMIPGLQHAMKQVIVSNLWDECGQGKIDNFHTTWLRRLLNSIDAKDEIKHYRKIRPWFTACTSNSFNSLLTSPAGLYAAYGHFLITESWVPLHFSKIIQGMNRLGMTNKNTQIYFTAHINIDKYHATEIIHGILNQNPSLTFYQLRNLVRGACQAVVAGKVMYDHLLNYFNNPPTQGVELPL